VSGILTVNDRTPDIAGSAFVAPGAIVAGDVELADGVNVWFGCVLRSEYERVTIGAETNIQDLSVVHADPGFPTVVGERVTVGHRVVLHGCTIEDDVLVGMGAVVMNGARIGARSVVGAGAVVTEGTQVPPDSLVVGVPAKVLEGREVPPSPRPNVAVYRYNAELYGDAAETPITRS
jgi:carbonic anhydrase/acetyltransferase-like protein (isoleucine patch superfamily)